MNMRIASILAIFLCSVLVNAQNVGVMFANMPQDMFPYLDSKQRAELVKLKELDMETNAVLRSSFGSDVKLLVLSDEYMSLKVDSTIQFEMSRVKTLAGDSLYCQLLTLNVPEPDTKLTMFDKTWRMIEELKLDSLNLIEKPDTMSRSRFDSLSSLIDITLVDAHFEDPNVIVLNQNVPMLSAEDKKNIKAILKPKRYKWDGKQWQ